ncbi:hypothetical protein V8G54_025240 [Vigna mungo]|uniref:Uncharacterized protein n=1 Tax=Vigna mungo TaxID=3915 RepID=A0AAQ3RQV2_VIGMU
MIIVIITSHVRNPLPFHSRVNSIILLVNLFRLFLPRRPPPPPLLLRLSGRVSTDSPSRVTERFGFINTVLVQIDRTPRLVPPPRDHHRRTGLLFRFVNPRNGSDTMLNNLRSFENVVLPLRRVDEIVL